MADPLRILKEEGDGNTVAHSPRAIPGPGQGRPLPGEAQPVRILSVDDSPDMHELYQKILIADAAGDRQMAGAASAGKSPFMSPAPLPTFSLDCANQGREALEMVIKARRSGRPYAVAFVDMRMPPGWDGIETIEQLWKVEPDLEVVICTAFIDFSTDDIISRLRRTDQLLLLKRDNVATPGTPGR